MRLPHPTFALVLTLLPLAFTLPLPVGQAAAPPECTPPAPSRNLPSVSTTYGSHANGLQEVLQSTHLQLTHPGNPGVVAGRPGTCKLPRKVVHETLLSESGSLAELLQKLKEAAPLPKQTPQNMLAFYTGVGVLPVQKEESERLEAALANAPEDHPYHPSQWEAAALKHARAQLPAPLQAILQEQKRHWDAKQEHGYRKATQKLARQRQRLSTKQRGLLEKYEAMRNQVAHQAKTQAVAALNASYSKLYVEKLSASGLAELFAADGTTLTPKGEQHMGHMKEVLQLIHKRHPKAHPFLITELPAQLAGAAPEAWKGLQPRVQRYNQLVRELLKELQLSSKVIFTADLAPPKAPKAKPVPKAAPKR